MSARPASAVAGRPGTGTRWLLIAALLAFALRVLVPVGYMPAPLADGWAVQLCPDGVSMAAMDALLGADGAHAHHHGTHEPHPPDANDTFIDAAALAGSCDFSSGLAKPLLAASAVLTEPASNGLSWLTEAPRPALADATFPRFLTRAPPAAS